MTLLLDLLGSPLVVFLLIVCTAAAAVVDYLERHQP